MVGLGAAARSSAHTSRWTPIRTRRTLRVANKSSGTPTSSAYQALELFAVLRNSLETRPAMPTACAAAFGELEVTPAMTPNPPTKTSASGNNQRNSRNDSAPAMIPPPTSTSVSTISNTASSEE